MADSDSERASGRKSRRHPLRILVDYVHEHRVHCEYATDLSKGGVFIETEAPLAPGTAVELRFRLPGTDHLHEIQGEVSWRRQPEQDGVEAPGMGVRFLEVSDAESLALGLERLLRDVQ